jgi:hypothetical protein
MKNAKKYIHMDKKGFVPEAEIFYIDPEKKIMKKLASK